MHWDQAYELGASTRSWYEDRPTMSLPMLTLGSASPGDSVVDIGVGAAPLVDVLLQRGFTDLTVLDISQAGLDHARRRLGPSRDRVSWVCADVLEWRPERRYRFWHDRALFHVLTDPSAQRRYLDLLTRAIEPDGRVAIGTFAADGPPYCSGLPVRRKALQPGLAC